MFISKNWRKIDKKIGHHQDQPSSGQAGGKVGRRAGAQGIAATAGCYVKKKFEAGREEIQWS